MRTVDHVADGVVGEGRMRSSGAASLRRRAEFVDERYISAGCEDRSVEPDLPQARSLAPLIVRTLEHLGGEASRG